MPHTSTVELPRILAAATGRVLARTGRRGVTYRAVAAEAEVTVRSIQNRFGSLDGLLDYVALRAFQELGEHIMGVVDQPLTDIGPSDERLAEARARYWSWAMGNPELHRLMFQAPARGLAPSAITKRAAVELLGLFGAAARSRERGVRAFVEEHGRIQLTLSGLGLDLDGDLRLPAPPSDHCANATIRPPLEGR